MFDTLKNYDIVPKDSDINQYDFLFDFGSATTTTTTDEAADNKIPYDAEFTMIEDAIEEIFYGLQNDLMINKDSLNFNTFYHYLLQKLTANLEFAIQLGIHKFGVKPQEIQLTVNDAKNEIINEVIELRKQDSLENEIEYRKKYGGYDRTVQSLRKELTKLNREYRDDDKDQQQKQKHGERNDF